MKSELKQLLSQRQKRRVVDVSRVPAAVLVPLYFREGEDYLLLTKRTQEVREHKGQVSFPGGTYQDEDADLLETALRECTEEIGLVPDVVEILGELDDTVSITSNYVITSFVGLIPWPYRFLVNSGEIERLIEVPVAELRGGACRREVKVTDGRAVTSYSYHYQGEVIWGATARILTQLLDILAGIRPGDEPAGGG
ncbi:NUDIX hydrolase [Chloroflexota bacterium]